MRTYLDARPIRSPIGTPDWIYVQHPAERERDDDEELYSPGILELPIQPGSPATIIAGTDPLPDVWSSADSLLQARHFERETIDALGDENHDVITRQLALAASQFRVVRVSEAPTLPSPGEGKWCRASCGPSLPLLWNARRYTPR